MIINSSYGTEAAPVAVGAYVQLPPPTATAIVSPAVVTTSGADGGDEDAAQVLNLIITPDQPNHQHRLKWYKMVFLCFVSTCGGPFGVESVVRNGGPLFALIVTVGTMFWYVAPCVLVMTELAAIMPTNHGFVEWIARALGDDISFVASTLQVGTYAISLAVFPVLARGYADNLIDIPSDFVRYLISLAIMLFSAIPAFFPATDMGSVAFLCLLIVVAPFVVGICAGLPTIDPSMWLETSTEASSAPTLMAVSVWMYSGFIALGNLAGEVEDHRVFLVGCGGGALMDCLMYLLPLMVALQVKGKWVDGYFATAFDHILPGLGWGVLVAGAVAGYALYASSLTCYSRALWGIAEKGWLPSILARTNAKTGVPWVAALAYLLAGCVLIIFDFDFLVTLELVISAANYVLFFAAFLVLRYREPDVVRPYQVPGGKLFAWVLVTPPVILFFSLFISGIFDWRVATMFGVMLAALVICYFAFVRPAKRRRSAVDISEAVASPKANQELLASAL